MKQIINKLGFLFLFLENLYLPIDLGFDFRINYLLQFFFIILILTSSNVKIKINFIVFYFIISVILFLIPAVKGFSILDFFKQYILITFQFLFCYLLIKSYGFDYKKIIDDYISIVYLASWIGVLQFVVLNMGLGHTLSLSHLGFNLGNFGGDHRIQSWFEEPSFLGYVLMPAVFIAISRVFYIYNFISLKKASLILIAAFLSGSSVVLIGILLSLIIIIFSKYSILKRPIYLSLIIITIPVLSVTIYNIPDVKLRVNDTYNLFTSKQISKEIIESTNLSTYALYSNYRVATESFFRNPLLGTGLGTYEDNYYIHINNVIPKSTIRESYHLNDKDANSLFLRLLTETGLIGLMVFLVFVISNRVDFSSNHIDKRLFWAFNNGVFVLIILRLLRQGHYTSLGFIMFLMLYWFLRKESVLNGGNN